ncbi:MAG TPA: GyrI-like domain-containing protein [Sphingomonadaceae bacterium]|nr:GyrI-like domain-containing protein [Sphingomonadaceae bacterium]
MKPTQRQIYAERIERVVRHIEERGADDDAPNLTELAEIAAMSAYHFHRVFRLMTGETVGEATRRTRLARTLPQLQGEATVTRAAGASGYATAQGFARALKAQVGTSATAARSSPELLDTLASSLRRPPRQDADEAPALRIEVVSLEPFRLLAVRNVGDYAELDRGFGRLFDLVLEQMSPGSLLGIYGVPYDDPRYTAAEACRFDCALATGAAGAPQGELLELGLGGGAYLRLRHLGNYDRLHAAIDAAYAGAIAVLDRAIRNAPLFVHYLDDPEEVAEAELRSDIFLPII